MEVIAKVKCNQNIADEQGQQHNVKLSAVTDGSEENKSFCRWTPTMDINTFISDETPASGFFEPGEEYYVTFRKVEK
jgi:hypothetical protein